jgi:hypothetical protein
MLPRLASALAGAVVLAASVARAQAPTPAPAPAPARRVVTQTASVNLLALPFGVASGEYERTVGSGFAVGVGGLATLDVIDDDDDVYGGTYDARVSTLQLKLKYYPREEGLRGFAVGITAGLVAASERQRPFVFDPVTQMGRPGAPVRRSVTAPTLGAVLDYNFLLGRRRRFLVGIGVGARRVLGGRDGVVDATLPDGRLQIGIGF